MENKQQDKFKKVCDTLGNEKYYGTKNRSGLQTWDVLDRTEDKILNSLSE